MKLKPFRLERYFAEHEFTAPYLLCCSDCESLSLKDLLSLEGNADEEFGSLWLGYTESQGNPELRTQIASLYQNVSSEQVLVHTGAEEAIFNSMNCLVDVGDRVVVHAPYYQSLGEVARSIGAEVVEWRGDPGNGWDLDLQVLKEKLTERTKLVVVNFPHNPTGFIPDTSFIHELSELSDARGFFVLCDEVYRGLEYNPDHRLPSYADINERGLSIGVMSKTYGLAGLRIGWIATRNQALYDALASFKDYTTICNSAPSEFLATLALRHREAIVERNLTIIKENLRLLGSFFSAHHDTFFWNEPKAGPIAFPRYLGESVERFCTELLQDTGVLLAPGIVFGGDYNCFRVGFGRRNMQEGLQKLEQFLVDNRGNPS